MIEGAIGVKSPFVRTPKFSVEGNKSDWKTKKYRGKMGLLPFMEVGLSIYFTYVVYYAWDMGVYGVIPFLCLFQFGFLYTGLSSLAQGLKSVSQPLLRGSMRFPLVPSKEELDPRPEKA